MLDSADEALEVIVLIPSRGAGIALEACKYVSGECALSPLSADPKSPPYFAKWDADLIKPQYAAELCKLLITDTFGELYSVSGRLNIPVEPGSIELYSESRYGN